MCILNYVRGFFSYDIMTDRQRVVTWGGVNAIGRKNEIYGSSNSNNAASGAFSIKRNRAGGRLQQTR